MSSPVSIPDLLEQVRSRVAEAVPGAQLQMVPNETPAAQPSLTVDVSHALEVARFLRDDPAFLFDYASNVTGVDWLDAVLTEKVKVRQVVDGIEKEVEETRKTSRPGYLEVVYHLYSMAKRHGPLILRQRTGNRSDNVRVASLTPVWRSCELQEREVFDLYGVSFEGHPDLRRILMWDGFKDYPMRRDYVDPDDFEYEPTPHGSVLERARARYPKERTA